MNVNELKNRGAWIRNMLKFCMFRSGVIVFIVLAFASHAFADMMKRSPTDCVTGSTGWTNPNNATSSNGQYATDVIGNSTTGTLRCTGYDFAIPAGSTIEGITVTVERSATAAAIFLPRGTNRDAEVRIVRNGTTGTQNRATTIVYETELEKEVHGGDTDLWGLTWTPAIINSANFGAVFSASNTGFFSAAQINVDHVEITVTYTPPDTTPPQISGITSYCGGINQLLVTFSEPLNQGSAQSAGNYSLNGATVTSATLQSDAQSVLLRTNVLPAGTYTLTVNGVRDLAGNQMTAAASSPFVVNGVVTQGIRGAYYSGISDQFPGTPVVRIDNMINFDWGNGNTEVPGIPADVFSVQWTGFFLPPANGNYVFRTSSDDGVRLYLDGQTLINNWTDHSVTNDNAPAQTLIGGQYYSLKMEFYENGGQAVAQLRADYPGGGTNYEFVRQANLFYCQIPTAVTPGRFNAFDPGTPGGATAGFITTKIAAQSFNLHLVALNIAAPPTVQTNFTGDVKVELLGNAATGIALDGNNCPQTSTLLGTATASFAASDSGRKTNVGFSSAAYPGTANAWRDVRVRISYPATGTATVVSCSGDNFAIRPHSLNNILVRDQDWMSAGSARTLNNVGVTGGIVHKAGRPFSISAEARNSAGTITTNYDGSPSVSALTCSGFGSGCTANVGLVAAPSWTAASGVVSTGTASYSEVGSFGLQLLDTDYAAVDVSDGSTAADRNIPAAAVVLVGRFVPDHFTVMASGSAPVFKTFNDTLCNTRSFTYIGQPFGYVMPPMALITARNASGNATTNYQNAWWKIIGTGIQQTYTSASGTISGVTLNAPAVAALNNNTGTGTITVDAGDLIKFDRSSTTPQAMFNADIVLTIAASDTSETSGAITTTTTVTPPLSPAVFKGTGAGIAFDAGSQFRYGILRLANAHGSELLPLPVPAETHFWNGSGFVLNTADHCTSLVASNISLNNFQKGLIACETASTISGRFTGGRGNLVMSAPGAGNSGSVDLRVNLASASGNACAPANIPATTAGKDYLRIKSGASYNADPTARASFGVRRSGPIIYVREIYGN